MEYDAGRADGVQREAGLMRLAVLGLLLAVALNAADERARRVDAVRKIPGFVALWDFVERNAIQPAGAAWDFHLETVNYVREFWGLGRPATDADISRAGRGPFGQAVLFRPETDPDFRPTLLVPRERLHDSGLDVKGPGRSVTLLAWVVRTGGNHAIAGIWHEGTDLAAASGPAKKVERGRRQYALFAGLAANTGGVAVHVSENGASSFGDKYARNLAVTPELIRTVEPDAPAEVVDRSWTLTGLVFDNQADTVTAYIDGVATSYWIDDPAKHPFFQWPANGWRQGQSYRPPDGKPRKVTVLAQSATERVELREYRFTKVRVTLGRDARGRWTVERSRELAALRANPFWFPHDLYSPAEAASGGPFTIGRVIHTSRSVGFTGWIGGVAVYGRALHPAEMKRLAALARTPIAAPK